MDTIAKIALDFPAQPTSLQILELLVRAERVGRENAARELRSRFTLVPTGPRPYQAEVPA